MPADRQVGEEPAHLGPPVLEARRAGVPLPGPEARSVPEAGMSALVLLLPRPYEGAGLCVVGEAVEGIRGEDAAPVLDEALGERRDS